MSKSFSSALSVVGGILLCFIFLTQSTVFAQAVNSEWTDVSLSGADAFSIDAEYRYKVSSQGDFWFYPKEISARSLVSNESYFGQIFYVSADAKTSYQYNGNFLGTVVQIQKRVLPPWTDVSLTGIDPFDITNEYRFKMTVPARPGVPAGDFWYYAKQVGEQSLVMDNGYGEITFVSAANKTAYLSRGTPTGITISQMQRRALTWNDVPLNNAETYDVSCNYRFKMNYPASPQWRPGVPAGDFWHYPERSSAQSHIANANGGYQTFSVFANNKAVFDFNGINNGAVLQMQKQCFVPPPTLCSEGQYFCTAENICKPAGQACNALCTVGTTVKWVDFGNPSSATGVSGTAQMGGQNVLVNYTGQINIFGNTGESQWNVANGNPVMFPNGVADNAPDQSDIIWTTGGGTTLHKVAFAKPVKDPVMVIYSIGWNRVEYQFDQPFTILKKTADVNKLANNTVEGVGGYVLLQFQGTFSEVSFKIPILEFTYTYGASGFNFGIPDVQPCPSVTCNNNNTCEAGESCNCGDCTNGGTDDADKCSLSSSVQMICTKDKDNTTTAGAFSSVTAQENFNTVNNKLVEKLSQYGNANISAGEFSPFDIELKMTQYDWKDTAGNFIFFTSFTREEAWTKVKELLSIPAGAQVLWSTSSIKYENDSLGDNERYLYSYVIQQTSGVQKQIFFATEFLPGANGWRKIYFVSKDYPLSTTTTGTEVCQNFTNPTLFGKPLALGSPAVGSSGIAPFCLEQGFRGNSTVVNSSFLTGWLTLWKATGTGWEPNQNGDKIDEIRCCGIPSNATGNTIQVGACCPAGKQWSSVQSACVGGDQCTPIVTLKKGSDLTTVTNSAGEAFSTNGACANKQISLSPCHFTTGAIPDGTSPSGNALYRWPKESSGLSRDYNLVEIKGQCWFADNLQENSTTWPSPVDIWENTTPHNGYGLYSYTGTGVKRPEGYLYQFDAATNNPTPGNGPTGSLQGVCPAGWHVATDCEFQYVEHALGMTVAEQQTVGVRASGAVGTAMKSGGNSGFDMPLSGARRYNTGFINGGSEGHLWSTDCDTSAWPSGGCYKRILNVSDGNITRIKGDGGTYDSAHHAAGSVRCVKDGVETPTTCPVAKCAEGQYYCHAELKCKAAGASCGTVTCNNNNVCDANESCDCADCNDKVDHCGLSSAGEQLICTKDTAEKCYTDKFPYCLSACLDGYKMDASGQCVQNPLAVAPSNSVIAYFGGMYSTGYNNPATSAQSCPIGYTATKISGTPNVDNSLYVCTRKSSDISSPTPTQYFDFGGMWGTSGGFTWYEDVFGPRIKATDTLDVNPYAGAASCPAGYTSQQVLGERYTGPLWKCSCAGYTSMVSTTNLTSGETCMYGNGGTEASVQYSTWSCTQIQSGAPADPLYTGPLYNCTCGGYMNRLSTLNLSAGQTCMYGNGGTVNNDQYSSWSCTELQSGASGAPVYTGPLYKSTCGGYMNMVTTSALTYGETCIFGNGGTAGNVQFAAWSSTPIQSLVDNTLNYCWKARTTAPTLPSEDFGGMWGMQATTVGAWGGTNYNNPVTGAATCPTGYTTKIGWGTSNVDWLFRWCYKTTEPQLGACCPPGSAWNSVENRCIPTTCGEGQFYCAAQKKCLAGGQTCDTAVCNNDGVCSGEESCQCGDCVNGGGDDKDKCSIVGGTQAMCSDDDLGDGKPGACCVPPKKWNTATSSCVECSNTQAPSELKAGVDQPYITCTGNGDTTKTHFKYRVTKQGTTDAPFISELYTVGTSVLHPTMTLGDYTVECFYGNATGVDTSTTATPHSCVKTMSVKSDAQGCSRVYPYKESTLSDEMISASAFDASFRCGSRKPVVGAITNPYMFRVGTQAPAYLSFDALISELFNGLTIGPVSTQTQNYNFDTGNTDVTCATKVGGGYSTNTACQLRTCVGGACNVPQTFSVVHSDDLICTTEETSTYNIGCNPAAPDGVRNQCIQWFRDAVNAGSRNVANGVEFNVSFVFNADAPTNVKCIKYVAGQMPGGLNLSDNVVCRATLNNGERYQIYAADTNGRIDALQTTAKTVERDRDNPTISEIKYYTDDTLTTEVPTTSWYNKPVVALAVCSDTPLNEATSCACSKTVDPATTDAAFWSVGVPNSLIGADLMRYTRTISESTTGAQKVLVTDTAGNKSQEKNIAVSLDTQAPIVALVESGTGTTKTVTLTASDTGSKIWKTTTAPSGATNTNGIIYRVGPKADIQTLSFDAECNTTSSFATVAETKAAGFPSQALATVSVNTVTHVVAYCVRDNAGNTARGIYPVITNACFSSSNMATIPKLDTYKDLLKTRLSGVGTDNQKYGYSFSENTADANCFRGILANNVTTLMANQLKAKTDITLSNWDTDRSQLSTSTTLSNGYYYYVYPTSNTLDIVTSPTASGAPVKTVVVDGGDIRIKTDLIYSGAGKTLLIIARKNANGQGGNIIIDTNVKRIDAILIADGGALKSSDATLPGERLVINGRVYSYNTRGGSLSVSGVDLIDAVVPKRFTNASLVNAGSLNDARVQDLERFRPVFADGTNTCSLTVNYTAFTTTNLPTILKRPSTFTGGSCGF